jgi:lysophospholipase L1-like esterase
LKDSHSRVIAIFIGITIGLTGAFLNDLFSTDYKAKYEELENDYKVILENYGELLTNKTIIDRLYRNLLYENNITQEKLISNKEKLEQKNKDYDFLILENQKLIETSVILDETITFWKSQLKIKADNTFNPTSVRIMFLGDSITNGTSSEYAYRKQIYLGLINQGYAVDFVGSKNNSDPTYDDDHEGHHGATTNGAEGTININSLIDARLELLNPDIIVYHIGSNDLNIGVKSPEVTRDGVNKTLQKIYSHNQHTTVILSKIIKTSAPEVHPPSELYPEGNNNWRIEQFNMLLDRVTQYWESKDKSIILVDLENLLRSNNGNLGSDYADFLHPNEHGYKKMADIWYQALNQILNNDPLEVEWIRAWSNPGGSLDHGEEISRGHSIRIYTRIAAPSLTSSSLTVFISYKPEGTISWTRKQASYFTSEDNWYIDWMIHSGIKTGLYDIKVEVNDKNGRSDKLIETGKIKIVLQ